MTVRLVIFTLATALAGLVQAAPETFDTLTVGSQTYSNVVITGQTSRDLFIKHTRGIANLKLAELDAATLRRLGFAPGKPDTDKRETRPAPSSAATEVPAGETSTPAATTMTAQQLAAIRQFIDKLTGPDAGKLLLIVIGVTFVFHLFWSVCARLICLKTGTEPGFLVWLPLFQFIPLLRAAGMSALWFLGLFVPVLNLITYCLWCVKISAARGKGALTTLALILPGFSILAFLYLAFSDPGELDDSEEKITVKPVAPEPRQAA